MLCAGAVNVTAFLAIKLSGSLTVKVWASVRNVFLMAIGVAVYGESVSVIQGVGYAIATGGFLAYTVAIGMKDHHEEKTRLARKGRKRA